VSLLDQLKRRFARPPEPVRTAVLASTDPDERVLAWGSLVRDGGWLVATSRGLRIVPPQVTSVVDAEVLPWHEIGSARWLATADGGGRFEVVPLTEVEPGVQARQPEIRHVLSDAGELPAVVRRLPGQPAREWTVVFDDDAQRTDPEAREAARQKLADLVAADQPD
jgi:hypothetical protein